MNLSKTIVLGTLAISMMSLTGCEKDIKKLQKAATKALGVAVTINTDATDVCARKQLAVFYSDYQALSKDDKASIKRLMRDYKGITIAPSTMTSKTTGEATILRYVGGGEHVSKILVDKRKTDGTSPRTVIEKGDTVTITAQGAVDESEKDVYVTNDLSVYNLIDTADSPALTKAIGNGQITQAPREFGALVTCGTPSDLRDLLK